MNIKTLRKEHSKIRWFDNFVANITNLESAEVSVANPTVKFLVIGDKTAPSINCLFTICTSQITSTVET